jgi:hypothetical protein
VGLEPSPTGELHLMILVKDIGAAIKAAGGGSSGLLVTESTLATLMCR